MEDKTDKYLREIIKDIKLETPSKNFTINVMNKISLEGKTVYKTESAFFSKYKFIIIFSLIFTGIFIIVLFFTDNQDSTVLNNINLDSYRMSFFDKIRDFFKFNFEFSTIHFIIITSFLILLSLDYVIPKILKSNNAG